ncbi:hypothetical protein IAT38_006865 [Cryptococcus sp. DSM 104549]
MDLVPYMYWENQEVGSQLCAQHCLNNILQQPLYTEFDLAEVAKRLDHAENAALDSAHQNKKSYNLDDTGFFSISVLERALQVWDLTLVRWRGEAMKPYQDHPEDQAAFILNLSSHWFALRRFAPTPPHSAASKRWYNLNSFLPNGPEWISPTYLRMVLTQAEEEGYSVFVIRKAGPGTSEGMEAGEGEGWGDGGVGVLPESLADRMAVELGEPVGRTGAAPTSGVSGATRGERPGPSRQASISVNPDQPTVDTTGSPPARPARRRRQPDIPSDPAAMEEDEFSRPPVNPRSRLSSSRSTPGAGAIAGAGGAEADVFDDTHHFPGDEAAAADDDEEIDEFDDGEVDEPPFPSHDDEPAYTGPTDFSFHARSYDDEDEALQAALKASMADLPEGWVAPPELGPKESEKPVLMKQPLREVSQGAGGSGLAQGRAAAAAGGGERAETPKPRPGAPVPRAEDKVDVEEEEEEDEHPAEVISPEEIRRRRLARFG